MLWVVWLSQNDCIEQNVESILHAGYLQGYPLGKDVGAIPKEERPTPSSKCMPSIRNYDNENFRQAWMTV
jgi:hypothetical protein